MLAQNIRIDRARRHTSFSRYSTTQARRVEISAAANDMLLGQTRELEGEVGQNVDRVCNQKQDGGLLQRLHVIDHAAQDVAIAVYEVRTRLACGCQCSELVSSRLSMEQ